MKFLLSLLILSSSAFAQEAITMDRALEIFDQYADVISKIEVGEQVQNDSYEKRGECVIHDQVILTVVELQADHALLLNERTILDKCQKTEVKSKFLSKDPIVNMKAFKDLVRNSLEGWSINVKEAIVTFEKKESGDSHTMQFDVRNGLLTNWVHYHHSYTGVEDHNIRNYLRRRIVSQSEIQGLPMCQKDPLRLNILKCE